MFPIRLRKNPFKTRCFPFAYDNTRTRSATIIPVTFGCVHFTFTLRSTLRKIYVKNGRLCIPHHDGFVFHVLGHDCFFQLNIFFHTGCCRLNSPIVGCHAGFALTITNKLGWKRIATAFSHVFLHYGDDFEFKNDEIHGTLNLISLIFSSLCDWTIVWILWIAYLIYNFLLGKAIVKPKL